MGDTDIRIDKLETRDADFESRWLQWVDKHDDKRDEFENRVYAKLDKVSEEIHKYNSANSAANSEVSNLRTIVEKLQKASEYHEKSINTFEVYLKNILDELHNVNLSVMKTDLDAMHNKIREQDTIAAKKDQELRAFQTEVRLDIQLIQKSIDEIKSSVGKYALKAWIWVISIVGTSVLTWFLTTIIGPIGG